MNCEQANEQFTEWLSNQLPDAERLEMEAHLATCPDCQRAAHATQQLWSQLDSLAVPEPSERMRVRFDAMLDTYKDSVSSEQATGLTSFVAKLRTFWTPQMALRLAYSLALIGFGILVGYWSPNRPVLAYQQQVDSLSSQVQEMRQMMLLSLIDNPSASERLRAVSYTDDLNQANERVVEALLTTLNKDPNVNVRLVTLEALAKLADDPTVRQGLVQSLTRQESPLVQAALADVMVKLQEKRSIKPLQQLLRQERLNDLVKSKIQESLKALS
ncbi:HEAT repeat domain-containing protein [Spirosoma sp. RP8]|uniref:HEAT repeat domain-containing protein n=1 Tax=Spirosoma liriopis TaxID=2937440 RepID=A0ABT0HU09_9BACT|nr:HEAT repeat domain-containing protein [Spirosoma liriopis]MCK8495675.1 HEAT repeat domain-containing protein [Spirosoma liriopis]